jgi:putative transposase
VRLIVALMLRPSAEQNRMLRNTLAAGNAAANAVSTIAWREQTFGQFYLHKLVYTDVRVRTGLTAQVVVRVISKVADAYQLDKSSERGFRLLGSLAYDDRILRYD